MSTLSQNSQNGTRYTFCSTNEEAEKVRIRLQKEHPDDHFEIIEIQDWLPAAWLQEPNPSAIKHVNMLNELITYES